jgi:hypothetical protein
LSHMRLMISPFCLSAFVSHPPLIFCRNAYEITLLSVCPLNFLVLYAVSIASKESRRLVLPIIAFNIIQTWFLFYCVRRIFCTNWTKWKYKGRSAHVSVVGRGTTLQAGRSRVRFPMSSLDFSIDLILPALGLTQPVTEMSTRNLPGGKGRPARKYDDITAICEPIV